MEVEHKWQSQVSVTPATWRDLRAVMELEKLCFGRDAWSALDVAAALTFPNTVRLKADFEERMIGLVIGDVRHSQQIGWIATIAVHPQYRRRGLGRRLLLACEDAMDMPHIKLTLRVTNSAALHLYRSEGYQHVRKLRGYYASGEDALVMEKIIPSIEPLVDAGSRTR